MTRGEPNSISLQEELACSMDVVDRMELERPLGRILASDFRQPTDAVALNPGLVFACGGLLAWMRGRRQQAA